MRITTGRTFETAVRREPRSGRGEVGDVYSFGVVQGERPGERLDDLLGDAGQVIAAPATFMPGLRTGLIGTLVVFAATALLSSAYATGRSPGCGLAIRSHRLVQRSWVPLVSGVKCMTSPPTTAATER